MSDTHDSRRRLEQVWWGILAGVVATLLAATTAYAAGASSLQTLLRGAGASESAPPR